MRRTYKHRAAILGGAFDPVHRGHLAMAKRALRDLPVAEVRLIPNGAPPHRPPTKHSWRERIRFCEKATTNLPRVRVGYEEPPGQIRYTTDTVRRCRRRGLHLILLMGSDAFAGFHRWRQWRRILQTANIAVARRKDGGAPNAAVRAAVKKVKHPRLLAEGAGRVFAWNFCPGDISSTAIRAQIKRK